jgi:two-component system phosphate regulon sensor histidine kinase PhoR
MFSSIRWRMALPFMLFVLLLVLGLGVYVSQYVRQMNVAALEGEALEESLHLLRQRVALIGLGAAGLAGLMALLIAAQTTRPLHTLTRAIQLIMRGELKHHLIPHSQDEIGQLTQALDTMAVQLHTQINALAKERSTLSSVLQQMADGVVIADEYGEVQLINAAAERIFNIGEENAIGRSVAEVLRHHQLVDLW